LYRRSIDGFYPTTIPGTEGAGNPFFSPTGEWVGFFTAGKLKKVSLLGGLPINICDAQAGYGASWGIDENIIFSPTFTSGLLKVSAAGGIPSLLTHLSSDKGELSHRWPEVLPDGKSVLYTVNTGMDGDTKHIAVYSHVSGKQRILIRRSTYARYMHDGYLLYYRGCLLFAVQFDIENLEIIGNEVKVLEGIKISGAGGCQYSISQNGSIVWVPSDDQNLINSGSSSPVNFRKVAESNLLWIDRLGKAKPVINTLRGYWAPSISPNGQQLAVNIDLDIYILEMYRETLTRFTFEGRNHLPIWTADGKNLVFSSARDGHPNLFRKKADGSGKAEKVLFSKQHQDPGSFTPDGKILIYTELIPKTNWDIWVMQLDDSSSAKPFLQTQFNEFNPMISPDGLWLAYTSNESGQNEIYVKPFPKGDGKWVISTDGGSEPVWARNGSELFYRNSGLLMAVKIKMGSTFIADKPKKLFERDYDPNEMNPYGSPNYDIGNDGRFLIIESTPSSPSTQIFFALNWFESFTKGKN